VASGGETDESRQHSNFGEKWRAADVSQFLYPHQDFDRREANGLMKGLSSKIKKWHQIDCVQPEIFASQMKVIHNPLCP
jgi:hypothetical protein